MEFFSRKGATLTLLITKEEETKLKREPQEITPRISRFISTRFRFDDVLKNVYIVSGANQIVKVFDIEDLDIQRPPERELMVIAREAHSLVDKLSNFIEEFNHRGGKVNLRVYYNEGSESIDLHDLNGEFEIRFFQVEELKLGVSGELDDEGNKIP